MSGSNWQHQQNWHQMRESNWQHQQNGYEVSDANWQHEVSDANWQSYQPQMYNEVSPNTENWQNLTSCTAIQQAQNSHWHSGTPPPPMAVIMG